MPAVSVVVPIYGAERYINRCLKSLFAQDFEDIEYIFINDCTPDKSMDTLYACLEASPRRKVQSRVINLESNIGISRVRQLGIQEATGRYIVFCDSDDYIEERMVSTLYRIARNADADCVLCEYFENKSGNETQSCTSFSCCGSDMIRGMLFNHIPGFIWRGLYSRDLLLSLSFLPDCNFAEDIVMNVQIWTNATRIKWTTQPLYHYCIRDNSLSTSKDSMAISRQLDSCRQVLSFVTDYLKQKTEYAGSYKDALVYFKRHLVASRFLPQEKYADKEWRKIYKNEVYVNPISYLCISRKYSSIREKAIFLLDVFDILPLVYRFKLRNGAKNKGIAP